MSETLIPLTAVPDVLPSSRGGKLSYSCVWRWINAGARGRRLDSVRIGGTVYTSREALQRFADPRAPVPAPPAAIRSASRAKSITQAEAVLDAAGIGGAK